MHHEEVGTWSGLSGCGSVRPPAGVGAAVFIQRDPCCEHERIHCDALSYGFTTLTKSCTHDVMSAAVYMNLGTRSEFGVGRFGVWFGDASGL